MKIARIAEPAAMTDAEASAVAYVEAAGDAGAALRWAIVDLIAAEQALADARRAISTGYVRGAGCLARVDPAEDEARGAPPSRS